MLAILDQLAKSNLVLGKSLINFWATTLLVASSYLKLHSTYAGDGSLRSGDLYRMHCVTIKTHDSESRGQEEAGRTRRMSVLFTGNTAMKFVNALNKPP